MQNEWSQGKGAITGLKGPLGGRFLQPLQSGIQLTEGRIWCPEPAWQGHRGWDGVNRPGHWRRSSMVRSAS